MPSDNAEAPLKLPIHEDRDNEGWKAHGGALLSERPTGSTAGTSADKLSGKLDTPTKADLVSQNVLDWDNQTRDQIALDEQSKKTNPYQVSPERGHESPAERAAAGKEADAKDISKLTDKDLKVVGDVAKALAGPNPAENALEVIKNAYDKDYPADRIQGIGTAMQLNLERAGLDKSFYIGISMGPDGGLVDIQDKRVNLTPGGGTKYMSYEQKIGKFD